MREHDLDLLRIKLQEIKEMGAAQVILIRIRIGLLRTSLKS